MNAEGVLISGTLTSYPNDTEPHMDSSTPKIVRHESKRDTTSSRHQSRKTEALARLARRAKRRLETGKAITARQRRILQEFEQQAAG